MVGYNSLYSFFVKKEDVSKHCDHAVVINYFKKTLAGGERISLQEMHLDAVLHFKLL